MAWQEYIPEDIAGLYEVYDYKQAATILKNEFPEEFTEICSALRALIGIDRRDGDRII